MIGYKEEAGGENDVVKSMTSFWSQRGGGVGGGGKGRECCSEPERRGEEDEVKCVITVRNQIGEGG